MAFLKVFTLLSLAAVLASSTPVEVEVPDTRSNEHNYYACTDYESEYVACNHDSIPSILTNITNFRKELLSNQQVYESASLLQVKEKVVKYPTSGISSKKITCINVSDFPHYKCSLYLHNY